MDSQRTPRAYAALVAVTLIWGFSFLATKQLLPTIPGLSLLFARFGIAIALLAESALVSVITLLAEALLFAIPLTPGQVGQRRSCHCGCPRDAAGASPAVPRRGSAG